MRSRRRRGFGWSRSLCWLGFKGRAQRAKTNRGLTRMNADRKSKKLQAKSKDEDSGAKAHSGERPVRGLKSGFSRDRDSVAMRNNPRLKPRRYCRSLPRAKARCYSEMPHREFSAASQTRCYSEMPHREFSAASQARCYSEMPNREFSAASQARCYSEMPHREFSAASQVRCYSGERQACCYSCFKNGVAGAGEGALRRGRGRRGLVR